VAQSGSRPRITVVGLGPADAAWVGGGVADLMAEAAHTFVRTRRHPAAQDLVGVDSFDRHYEAGATFEDVYRAIVEELVAEATRQAPVPVVYAVPGSPLIAERTVELLRDDRRVDVTIMPGLSFLDLAWERLGLDPLRAGVRLVDAERFSEQATGDGPFLVAQCWSRSLLSEIKLSASDDEAQLPEVVVLHHLGLDDEQVVSVDWWEMDRTITPDHLTSLFIPRHRSEGAVDQMARLEELMRTLRAQCPWDRAQTHATLMPHLLEESYEVLDALEELEVPGHGAAASAHLEEELGDLLFQIVFHAELASEEGWFTLADVARGVHDKLVHRHPHVFGDVDAGTTEQVVSNWEAIKKEEKGRTSVTDGIPNSLPALMLSTKLQRKALGVGLDAPDVGGAAAALPHQVAALARSLAPAGAGEADAPLAPDAAQTEELVGDLLFALADLSRRLGVDPEQALRARARAFRDDIVARETETETKAGSESKTETATEAAAAPEATGAG
jgi:tetrapyrrole methylase family protein / MazG family protein